MLFSTDFSTCSRKQLDLLNTFRGLIEQYGIKIHLDEPLTTSAQSGQDVLSVDVEHDESGAYVLTGFYHIGTNSYYGYTSAESLCRVYDSSLKLVAHNWNGDFECLRQWGFEVKDDQLVGDTMLTGHILDSSLKAYGLKDMAKRELGIEYPSYDDIVGKRGLKAERVTLDKQPIELVVHYNAMDVYSTAKLYERQRGLLTTSPSGSHQAKPTAVQYFEDVEKPVSKIFNQMSTRGIRVDLEYLRDLKETLEEKKEKIILELENELGPIQRKFDLIDNSFKLKLNLNSPKQLLEALNAKDIYPELKGKPSTDKRALERFKNDPIVSSLLRFSELETLLSSFVYPYLERGTEYVHPFYNQVGTRTGRLSCSNPNLLQIPKHSDNGKLVRHMFIPRDGMLLGDADYGQIEPRIMAHFSKDPNLCEVFRSGKNFHKFTQQRMGFPDTDDGYKRAKVLNLSVGYRATFKSVSSQLKCSDKEAQNEIDKWWALFPTLRRWQDKLIFESKRSGFVTTLLGRHVRVDDLSHGNSWRREGAERQLINNIAQASAREVIVLGMIRLSKDDRLSSTFGMLIQVYDDLVFETSQMENDSKAVVDCMTKAIKLEVPLVVDLKIGPNWGDVE